MSGVAGIPAVAGASAIEVDPSDPNAKGTIQAAVDAAADGDTILVAPGTYQENVYVPDTKGLSIVGDPGGGLRGPGPDAPILDGQLQQGVGFYLDNGGTSISPTTIDGFEIRSYGDDINDSPGRGIVGRSRSDVTLQNLWIHDIAGSGVQSNHRGLPSMQQWTVRDSEFRACAHWAVFLINTEGIRVENNHVKRTLKAVSDTEDVWWERGTEDGHPQGAIKIEGGASDGKSGLTRAIVLEGNLLEGTYDDAVIRLFSYNINNPPAGTKAELKEATVRNNTIRITDEFDDEALDERGILLDANSSSHPRSSGRPISPSEIHNVTIVGNEVEGASHGFKTTSMTPLSDGGIRNVSIENNVARNCQIGFIPITIHHGGLENITLRNNSAEECDNALVVWGGGSDVLRRVQIENLSDSNPGARTGDGLNNQTGVIVVGFLEGAVRNVTLSGYSPPDRPRGMWLASRGKTGLRDVSVSDVTLEGVDEGMLCQAATGNGFETVTVRESTFTADGTGLRTEVLQNGTPSLGDAISVHRSDFTGNSNFAIDNRDGGGVISGSCNFWGHATGPTHDKNRPGRGDKVTDGVDYSPWLPQSFMKVPEEACHGGQQHDD